MTSSLTIAAASGSSTAQVGSTPASRAWSLTNRRQRASMVPSGGGVQRAGQIGPAACLEGRADPRSQLRSGLAGEGDRHQPLDGQLLFHQRLDHRGHQ